MNSTNLNLFYGEELLIFFFIVCFFFCPPSCQLSSTWIELFDLRAAVQKEEETPPASFHTSPTMPCPGTALQQQGPTAGAAGQGQAPGRTSLAGQERPRVSSWAPCHIFSVCAHIRPCWCLFKGFYMSRVPMSFPCVVTFTLLRPCDGCPSSLQQVHHPEPATKGPVNQNPTCLSGHFSSCLPFPSGTSVTYEGICTSGAWRR